MQCKDAPGRPDEFHKQMGDLNELFGKPTWRRHLLIGMTLGMVGQVGIWGIGFWTPELIRGAQLERRRAAVAQEKASDTEIIMDRMSLAELAAAKAVGGEAAPDLLKRWQTEDDSLVGRGTVLQDLAGMCGIYAFTWFTGRAGRRLAFAVAYLLGLAATLWTFSMLRQPADVYWMIPMLGFCVSSVFGGFAIYFPELFPTRLRSTGVGFCYNVARYVTALGPLTLGKLSLVYASMDYAMPLRPAAMTLSLVYVLGVIVLRWTPETKGQPLPE